MSYELPRELHTSLLPMASEEIKGVCKADQRQPVRLRNQQKHIYIHVFETTESFTQIFFNGGAQLKSTGVLVSLLSVLLYAFCEKENKDISLTLPDCWFWSFRNVPTDSRTIVPHYSIHYSSAMCTLFVSWWADSVSCIAPFIYLKPLQTTSAHRSRIPTP